MPAAKIIPATENVQVAAHGTHVKTSTVIRRVLVRHRTTAVRYIKIIKYTRYAILHTVYIYIYIMHVLFFTSFVYVMIIVSYVVHYLRPVQLYFLFSIIFYCFYTSTLIFILNPNSMAA